MTEAEYILADFVLLRMPIGKAIDMHFFIGMHLLQHLQEKYPDNIYSEIREILINNNQERITIFLYKEKYIEIAQGILSQKHIITDKGIQAQDLGGHEKYNEWVNKQERKNSIEDFPKRKWFIYEPLKLLLTIIITFIITWYIKGCVDQSQPLNKKQVNSIRPYPQKPKTSDTLNRGK